MRKLLIFIGIIFLSGCAMTYKAIEPESIPFYIKGLSKGISYSYQYDVLEVRGNKRYAKKEFKNNLRVVAVKLTNNTDSVLDFREDIAVILGDVSIMPMESRVVNSFIRQPLWPYLFYLPLIVQYENIDGSWTLPIGIPIGLGNMAVAGNANVDFKGEFGEYNLVGKSINPNETIKGLICFHSFGNHDLKFELKNNLINGEINSDDETGINNTEYIRLEEMLLLNNSDESYNDYILRVVNYLEKDMRILSYEKYAKRYKNGNFKKCGLKAKHKYSDNYEYNFKIGSWIYFDESGNISKVEHFDIKGHKVINIHSVNWLNELKGYDINSYNKDSLDLTKPIGLKPQYVGSESMLFFGDEDELFEDYIIRVISNLELDNEIISYEKVAERYRNGRLNKRGLKVCHNYSEDKEERFRIGTWEYFDEFGKLIRTIDFDIMGNIVTKKVF